MSVFLKRMEEWEKQGERVGLPSGGRGTAGFHALQHKIPENEYTRHCIYLVREIKSFSPNEPIGHILLITTMENIREVLNEYLDKEVEYTLLRRRGYCLR